MTGKKRIGLLDLWRTVAIAVMLAYHFVFDLTQFGCLREDIMSRPAMTGIRLITASSFIFISGISVCFSKAPARRGITVFGAGLLVTAASLAVSFPIYFGTLQLLGICMVLYGLFENLLSRLPVLPTAFASAALFLVCFPCASGVKVSVSWLWMFGFVTPDFFSGDYYPLLPWMFMFILGTCLGRRLETFSYDSRIYARLPEPLIWPGKHSLAIYLLHQPVLYGLCALFVKY